MRFRLLGAFIIWGAVFVTPLAQANVLFLEGSDFHSAYKDHISGDRNPEIYLRATARLSTDFKKRSGSGSPVFFLLNGDIAGASMWSVGDRGEGMWNFFAELTLDHSIIPGLGNHEGTDYAREHGNQFMLDQNRRFLARANARRVEGSPPIRFTVANLIPDPSAADLFQPYEDRVLANGKRLRVLGFVLDRLLEESAYSTTDPVQVWKSVTPMLEEAKRQLIQAASAGVSVVVIQCHDRISTVQGFVEKLLEWKAARPELAAIKIPFVFAAHDHRVAQAQIGETRIFDSGTEFTFTQAEMTDDGDFVQASFLDRASQKVIGEGQELSATERSALAMLEPEILKQTQSYGKELGTTAAYPDIRSSFEKARSLLGIRLADGLRQWAIDSWLELSKTSGLPAVEGAMGFYNSGSYRLVQPIEEGTLTYGHLVQMMPFQRSWGVLLLKGADIQAMFAAIRLSQEKQNGIFTPQFSSNLREVGDHQLEIRKPRGGWVPLQADAYYATALEGWLDINGYKIPEIDTAFRNGIRLKPPIQDAHEVMGRYFPAELAKRNSCHDLLKIAD